MSLLKNIQNNMKIDQLQSEKFNKNQEKLNQDAIRQALKTTTPQQILDNSPNIENVDENIRKKAEAAIQIRQPALPNGLTYSYQEFLDNYKYGILDDENLKKFYQTNQNNDKVTFNQCVKAARTGGAICDPKGESTYCPYMAYENLNPENKEGEGNCWVGGFDVDSVHFNPDDDGNRTVFLTPLDGDDMIDRVSKSTVDLKSRLDKRKEDLDRQILQSEIYEKAVKEGISFEEALKRGIEERKLMIKQAELDNKMDEKNKLEERRRLLESLLKEKNLRDELKLNEMNVKRQKLDEMDDKILTVTEMVRHNGDKYEVNEYVSYILGVSIIIFILLSIYMVFYYE